MIHHSCPGVFLKLLPALENSSLGSALQRREMEIETKVSGGNFVKRWITIR